MKQIIVFSRWFVLSFISLILFGCASTKPIEHHGFKFDFFYDNQTAIVLDYWYGDKSRILWGMPEYKVKQNETIRADNTWALPRRGDYIYIKWRDGPNGEVYEDKVDLRSRLPADITGSTIYLMIYGPKLYVYLATTNHRPAGENPNGPSIYENRRVLTIYPD